MTIFTRLAIVGVVTSLLAACSDSNDSTSNNPSDTLDDPTDGVPVDTVEADGDGIAEAPTLSPTADTSDTGETSGNTIAVGMPINDPAADVTGNGSTTTADADTDGEATTGDTDADGDATTVDTDADPDGEATTVDTDTDGAATAGDTVGAGAATTGDADADGDATTVDIDADADGAATSGDADGEGTSDTIDPMTDTMPGTSEPLNPSPDDSLIPSQDTTPPTTTTEPDTGDVEVNEYTRTKTEALSIGGPSRTDAGRTDGIPTAPTGVSALLIADNWVEFGWVPSTDDGAIVAYDIYRDGQLVATVDDDEETNSKEENRDWRTTTYIDCNFTKDIDCQTVGQPQPGTTHAYTVVAIDNDGNRSAASAPGVITLNMIEGSAAPEPESSGYSMTFEDDFEGNSLDRDKWRTSMPWGPDTVVNGEKQYFVDVFSREGAELGFNPFVVSDGTLKITGIRTPAELLASANNQPYLSGVITTRDRKDINYGYVEMRAKVPGGSGLLSTFYLLQPGGNQYEIDILEYDGREPDGATQNYHYRDGFRFQDTGYAGLAHASPTMKLDTGVNLSASFHTYSVLWEPELIIWYIDGIEVRRMTGPRVSNADMNIVAQQVIGSNWIGDPTEVAFPVAYEIDYMRVWEK